MKPTKTHFRDSRDRVEDLNTLGDSFFDYLVLNTLSRSNAGVWGLDPQWLLGRSHHGKNKVALEVLDVLGIDPGECEHCGQSMPGSKHTKEQLEYANELWADLGEHLTSRWAELRQSDSEETHEEDDEEEEESDDSDSDDEDEDEDDDGEEVEVCSRCGEEIHTGGCDYCDNDEDEDEDDEEEEDDE